MEKQEAEPTMEAKNELVKEVVKKSSGPDLLDSSNNKDVSEKWITTVATDYYEDLMRFGAKLERDTNTQITISKPPYDVRIKHIDVTVIGKSKIDLEMAKEGIYSILKNARLNHKVTHFLGLPLNTQKIQERFLQFKKEVLNSIPGIKESYFENPTRLHLTLGVFAICDDNEKYELSQIIQETCTSVFQKILANKKLALNVKGISRFRDLKSDSKVRVIFAKVTSEQEGLLEEMYLNISNQLCEKGVIKPVKSYELHLTLINARHPYTKRFEFFDATNLLKTFGEFEFGSVLVDRVDVAVMGSLNENNEYYNVIKTVPIETVSN